MSHSTISLGLGLGGGKSATSSGSPGGDVPLVNAFSVEFDGSDDSLEMGTNAVDLDTNFTISTWVKPSATTSFRVVGGWGNGANGQLRAIEIVSGKVALEIWNERAVGATTVPNGSWTHIAVTLSGNNAVVYHNGSADGTATFSTRASFSTSTTFIGRQPSFLAYVGLIDEFAVFNSVLTQPQIEAIYNGGTPATFAINPLGWWRMGDADGDTDSGGGAPANTDVVGTIVNKGELGSDGNGVGTNGPKFSTDVP